MSSEASGYNTKENNIRDMLRNMSNECNANCDVLVSRGHKSERMNRHLQVGSGVMALISGLVTTAVFADLVGAVWVKVIAALLAFFSGFITLINVTYVSQKEVQEMFEGNARFMELRDAFWMEAVREGSIAKQLEAAWEKHSKQFAQLSARFSRYIPGPPLPLEPND
jgi:hypothetical protein